MKKQNPELKDLESREAEAERLRGGLLLELRPPRNAMLTDDGTADYVCQEWVLGLARPTAPV